MRALRTLGVALFAALALAAPAHADGTTTYDYVKVSDGTEIAIATWFPEGYDAGERWPVLFEMDGYGGARNVNDKQFHGTTKDFIVVYASVRGSGCSGGKFDLFGERSAQDGYEIIEDWIVKQPWSDGHVGITGHSYSGLTGFLVAATSPPHVDGVAVCGLIDDLYRGHPLPGWHPQRRLPGRCGAAACARRSRLRPTRSCRSPTRAAARTSSSTRAATTSAARAGPVGTYGTT